MSNFNICRVCLASNIRLYSIANTPLQEVYENLTRIKLLTQGGWPATVCYICLSQLQKCIKLMELAEHSQKQLLDLYHSVGLSTDSLLMIDHTLSSYSLTPIESISLNTMDLSESISSTKDTVEIVKQELDVNNGERNWSGGEKDEPEYKVDWDYENDLSVSSDSEDNVPLTEFKKVQKVLKREQNKQEKRKYQRDVKINAQEILLTKEQQIEAVVARSKSLNYLNSPFKCHLCYKGFVNEMTYSNHTQKHDESSGAFKCEVCALRYRSARLLRTHSTISHARYFQCNTCQHVSHTTNQARDHDKCHEGFTFHCKLCNKKFRKRTSYLTHTRKNHHTESICELCGYSFVSKNGLILHKSKSHKQDIKEEKPPVPPEERSCHICSIQFICLEAYHRHLLSSVRHTQNYTYSTTQCVICKQTYPDNESLLEHIKIHKKKLLQPAPVVDLNSILARLPCDVCGVSFTSRSRLAAHVSRKHLGVKYVKHVVCEMCGLQFKSRAQLRWHHGAHAGVRPHACARCPRRFARAHALRLHARTHDARRPHACLTCDKRFTQKAALNRHYRVHTGAKPYTCQVCSKCFSQSNSLKIHIQSVHLKMPPHRKRKRVSTKNDMEIKRPASVDDVKS